MLTTARLLTLYCCLLMLRPESMGVPVEDTSFKVYNRLDCGGIVDTLRPASFSAGLTEVSA